MRKNCGAAVMAFVTVYRPASTVGVEETIVHLPVGPRPVEAQGRRLKLRPKDVPRNNSADYRVLVAGQRYDVFALAPHANSYTIPVLYSGVPNRNVAHARSGVCPIFPVHLPEPDGSEYYRF